MRRIIPIAFAIGCAQATSKSNPPEEKMPCENDLTPTNAVSRVMIGKVGDDGRFSELENGQEINLEYGIQGGQHITVNVQFFGSQGVAARHFFTVENTRGVLLGGIETVEDACLPGLNTTADIIVLISTSTTVRCNLNVETSILDEPDVILQTMYDRKEIRIVDGMQ